MPRNNNNSVKTGLRLKEKSPKESVPRNHKSNLKQPGQRESKRINTENDSDDDWVWDFDLDKVINAYQILVRKKKRFGDMYFIVTKDKSR